VCSYHLNCVFLVRLQVSNWCFALQYLYIHVKVQSSGLWTPCSLHNHSCENSNLTLCYIKLRSFTVRIILSSWSLEHFSTRFLFAVCIVLTKKTILSLFSDMLFYHSRNNVHSKMDSFKVIFSKEYSSTLQILWYYYISVNYCTAHNSLLPTKRLEAFHVYHSITSPNISRICGSISPLPHVFMAWCLISQA
jgi:hypothetical protein